MLSKENFPLVAVLTPVFNGARYLDETMQCVQGSDYPNLVHVLLDNASTDATPAIIERYRGGQVPIVSRRNDRTIPMNDNFNAVAALTPAGAKYVRLLCADDLMAPSAISRMVAVAERRDDVSVVGCQCANVGVMGIELDRRTEIFTGASIVKAYLRRQTMVLSGTHFLFRRSVFDALGQQYDPSLASSDADCVIRVALEGAFGFVHDVLAKFRHHESSYSAKVATKNGAHLFEWLTLLDRYALKVMSEAEYSECRRIYRRYLLRRSLLRLVKHGDQEFFSLQLRRLAELDDSAGIFDFAGALGEWAFFAATGQRHRVGAPRNVRGGTHSNPGSITGDPSQ
ncbi:MAG: glycosyltransferase [Mesorhizobium sp.]|nr:MAG: glycosyltransferase [Mesorhizobium sp.]